MAHDSAEHRLEIKRRADCLAHVPQRSQFLNGPSQLTSAGLQFLKQPDIFYSNDRLVSKGRHQLNLLIRERLDFGIPDGEDSHQVVASHHWDAEHCTNSPQLRRSKGEVWVGQDVGNINCLPLQRSPRGDAVTSWGDRVAVEEFYKLRGWVVGERMVETLTIEPVDRSHVRPTEPDCVLRQCFQDRLQVKRDKAGNLEALH